MRSFLLVLVWLISPRLTCNAYSLRNHQSKSRSCGALLAGTANSDGSREPTSSDEEHRHERTDGVSASSSWLPATTRRSRSAVVRTASTQLGLLTFDLDDTLFVTTPTVREANEAQVSFMNAYLQNNHNNDNNNHITVEHILQTTREIRRQVVGTSQTYTALRKMAIRRLYKERLGLPVDNNNNNNNNNNLSWLDTLTEETFQVWLHERHRAAERHLFDGAVTSLQQLRRRRPDGGVPEACVAAITNGRGDPTAMPALRDFFDFCVSGEDEDVFPYRKPHAGIYQVALQRYRELYPEHHQDHRAKCNTMQDTYENGHEPQEPEHHYIWVHVGDCLANDVGASAECGAWTIWFAPTSDDDDDDDSSLNNNSNNNNNSWSTASTAEWRQRQTLAEQARDKVSIRITCWAQLEGAIDELLRRADIALSNPTKRQ